MSDLNQRPSACKAAALPLRQSPKASRAGFEPATHNLEGCCTNPLCYRDMRVLYWYVGGMSRGNGVPQVFGF